MFDPFSDLTARPAKGLYNLVQEGLQTLFHLLLFSLLLLGFGGLIYKALRSGGGVGTLLTKLLAQHPPLTVVGLFWALPSISRPRPLFKNSSTFGKRGDPLGFGWLPLGVV